MRWNKWNVHWRALMMAHTECVSPAVQQLANTGFRPSLGQRCAAHARKRKNAGSLSFVKVARLCALTASVIVIVDQITKALAVEFLSDRAPVTVLGPVLSLDLVRNPGAAFSFGTGNTVVFTVLSTVVSIALVVMSFRLTDRRWAIGLGMLLAGAVGNLIDRLVRDPGFPVGHVIDMFRLPNFPVFNVADISITFSVVFIMWLSFRGIEPWPDKKAS